MTDESGDTPVAQGRTLYYGGAIRFADPFDRREQTDARIRAAAKTYSQAVLEGIRRLTEGSSSHTADAEPVPNAPLEHFAYFNAESGEYVMAWRIACRHRGDDIGDPTH